MCATGVGSDMGKRVASPVEQKPLPLSPWNAAGSEKELVQINAIVCLRLVLLSTRHRASGTRRQMHSKDFTVTVHRGGAEHAEATETGSVDLTLSKVSVIPVFSALRIRERLKDWELGIRSLRASAQSMTPHDLEKARVIREPERFGSLGDVPVVLLERGHNDLPFGLCLHRFQRTGCR